MYSEAEEQRISRQNKFQTGFADVSQESNEVSMVLGMNYAIKAGLTKRGSHGNPIGFYRLLQLEK